MKENLLTASQSSFVARLVFLTMQSHFPLEGPDALHFLFYRAIWPIGHNQKQDRFNLLFQLSLVQVSYPI